MTGQLPLALDGVPAPIPRARTQTSYEAAIAQVPRRQQRKAGALWLYRQAGERGLTDFELAEAMGIPVQSSVPLRTALANDGEVVRRWGEFRNNRYGNPCQVWRVKC